jgi:hypothetical protein
MTHTSSTLASSARARRGQTKHCRLVTMGFMAEPVPAADETAVDTAQTAAVSNPAAAVNLAWSRDVDHDVPTRQAAGRQSWPATWRKAAALLVGGLVLAGAIVAGFWVSGPDNKGSQPGPGAPGTPMASGSPAPTATGATAPPSIASTPEQDNKYVQSLNARGISFANPEAAIHNGKTVCQDIRQGMTVPQVVDAFRASNPALGADADTYVAISIRAYCPQNGGLVSGTP